MKSIINYESRCIKSVFVASNESPLFYSSQHRCVFFNTYMLSSNIFDDFFIGLLRNDVCTHMYVQIWYTWSDLQFQLLNPEHPRLTTARVGGEVKQQAGMVFLFPSYSERFINHWKQGCKVFVDAQASFVQEDVCDFLAACCAFHLHNRMGKSILKIKSSILLEFHNAIRCHIILLGSKL